jgi:hypothetical protein
MMSVGDDVQAKLKPAKEVNSKARKNVEGKLQIIPKE